MADKDIIAYNVDGHTIYIEGKLPENGGGFVAVDGEKVVLQATNTFEKSMEPVVTFARKMITRIANLDVQRPTEIELEFGIKLTGAVDFWVISGEGEGAINLKLTWKNNSENNGIHG